MKKEFIAIIAVFFVAALVVLSFLTIDLTGWTPRIKSAIEAKTDYDVTIGRIALRPLPYPRLTLHAFSLSDEKETVFSADSLEAGFSVLPLLRKEISVKTLSVEGAFLSLRRKKQRTFDLKGIKEGAFEIVLKKFEIRGLTLKFFDEVKDIGYIGRGIKAYFSGNSRGFSFSAGGSVSHSTAFYTSGLARRDGEEVNLSGTLAVENLKTAEWSPYLEDLLKETDAALTASAELVYSFSGNPRAFFQSKGLAKGSVVLKDISIETPNIAKPLEAKEGRAQVELTWGKEKFTLAAENASFKLPGFDINGSFRAELPEKTFEIRAGSTPIPLSYIKELAPAPARFKTTFGKIKNLAGAVAVKSFHLASDKTLSVEAEAVEAGFTHPSFKRRVSGIGGNLSLKDKKVSLTGFAFKYGNSRIEKLKGEAALDGELILEAAARVDAEETTAELKSFSKAFDEMDAKGVGALSISIERARSGAVKVSHALNLKGVEVKYGARIKKEADYPASLKGVIAVGKKETAAAGSISVGKSTASVKGVFSRDARYQRIEMSGKGARIYDIVRISDFFVKNATASGEADIGFLWKMEGKKVEKAFEINVREGAFKMAFFESPVKEAYFAGRFRENSGSIVVEKAKLGESPVSGKIDMLDFKGRVIGFNIFSEMLNLMDLLPPKSMPAAPAGGVPPPPITGAGRVTAKNGVVRGLSLSAISADMVMDPQALRITPLSFTSHDGRISGNIAYYRAKNNPLLFDGDLSVSSVFLQGLVKELGAKEEVVSGRLSAEVHLSGRRWVSPVTAGLAGSIDVSVNDGKLYKFVVFSKIFSIVNIISITELFEVGMPFERINGRFTIKDGVVETEDLSFKSASLRMSAVGSVDVPGKTIDATLGVQPFVTIDKIISRIPIAGWWIVGEERAIITMYYGIKGALKNPAVDALPVRSVGEKVLGIFERILETPVRALEPAK